MNNKYEPKHTPKTNISKNNIPQKDLETKTTIQTKEKNKKIITITKKKRRLKKWVWQLFTIIFLITIIISLTNITVWHKENEATDKVVEEISNETIVTEQVDDDKTELVNQDKVTNKDNDYWYYIKTPLIDVDIQKLKAKNSDTIGWINVNNTNINYPFVQTTNNDYYLTHSFDKTANNAGWIFLDYRNQSDFSDKNNIIYGHSRLNKTMFGSLHNALSSKWYSNKDNHIIRLSTEKENTMWQIFSVYKIKAESYYITTNFTNDNEYQDFLNTITSRSKHKFKVELSIEDKILTLSTCYSDDERTVVHAKLIKRSPR